MRRSRRNIVVAGLVGVAMGVSACAADTTRDPVPPRATVESSPMSPPPPGDGRWQPSGDPTTLVTDLAAPWSVAPLPNGGALISERDTGSILEWDGADSVRTAGVVPDVVSGGESGLHGIALWADADGRDWLYAYHGADDDNRVVRMPLDGESGALTLGEPEPVLTGIPRERTHNGGRIAFGPDGLLYISTGDAQLRDAAQDEQSLAGKILRVTPEGEPAPDNPFGNAVWSMGHRNVQGLAWTSDGAMWASEFGQNTWDELNSIVPGGNYGWPIVEGEDPDGRFVDPVVIWATSEASPSGIAAIGSTVFVAGLRGERLWVLDTTDAGIDGDPRIGLDGQGRLRDVIAAPDGALWVLTNNTDGRGSPRAGDDILLRLPVAAQE